MRLVLDLWSVVGLAVAALATLPGRRRAAGVAGRRR